MSWGSGGLGHLHSHLSLLDLLAAPAFSAPLCVWLLPPSALQFPADSELPQGGEQCLSSALAPDPAPSRAQKRHQRE